MTNKIGFGGGCHWCTEAVFQSVKGVEMVEQGWISSEPPYTSFSEAVIVCYNDQVSLFELILIHIKSHSSTSNHDMRDKYRSAIYYNTLSEKEEINNHLEFIQKSIGDNIITKVLPLSQFKINQEEFQNYYHTNPERPFCQRYISPKLETLANDFSHLIKTPSDYK